MFNPLILMYCFFFFFVQFCAWRGIYLFNFTDYSFYYWFQNFRNYFNLQQVILRTMGEIHVKNQRDAAFKNGDEGMTSKFEH